MPRKRSIAEKESSYYFGADVPMRVIRRYARQIAKEFHPEKIVLFGSHAYGTPHADSDVDLLVVMTARNELDQAYRISSTIPAPFPVDLLVRTPHNMKWRIEAGDWFLREVTSLGKTLYESTDEGVGTKGRVRLSTRRVRRPRR